MSHAASAAPTTEVAVSAIPVAELAPWALFFGLLATFVLFFVSADQGAVSLTSGTLIHEFVHDGRHLLAFPCH
jgi:hypothetical protein